MKSNLNFVAEFAVWNWSLSRALLHKVGISRYDLVSVFGLESRQMFPAFFSWFPRVQYSVLKLNQDHNIHLYLISISGMSLRRDFYNFEGLYRIIFCLQIKVAVISGCDQSDIDHRCGRRASVEFGCQPV